MDAGCGAGRFAEVALKAGAKLEALDYSSAVDACYANLKHHPNLYVVQGDIYALPFALGEFPFVYSLGVLQHMPDVANAFAALPPMVQGGGNLLGRVLKRLVPVADYTGIFPLSEQQLKEWALLDTFDMLAPTYDNPQSAATVQGWFEEAKLLNIEVGHWGHLVGRGKKLG